MSSGQFPREAFNKSLLVTSKMKTNMKPFIEEYTKGNILWMYESISILLNNFLSAAVEPEIKMNSMFGIKCMVDTCDYVLIALIQAYIFPIIRRVASVDLSLKQQQRGCNMFLKNNEQNENLNRVGYTYVKLSSELLNVLSVIKPWKLYYNMEAKDPSQFKLAFQQISKQYKHKAEKFLFFKQDPHKLHELYKKKTQQFDENSENYSKFFQEKFFQQIKVGFANQILDIRELLKQGDAYITDGCLQSAGNVLASGKSCNIIRYAIHFVSKIVQSGNSSVCFFMHSNKQIKRLVKQVINAPTENKKLDRGQHYFLQKKGTVEERKSLYNQFLRSLEVWGNTFVKISLKAGGSSNVEKYYKILKHHYKFQFPNNLLLQKQIKEAEQNFRKNKHRNHQIQTYAKNELQEQKEDSIIQTSKVFVNSSKVVQAGGMNLSKKQITPQPKQDEDKQCKDLIKNIKKDLGNLQKNQRQLPNNMRAIQKNISLLLKKIEQVQLDDQQLQILMSQSIDLEEKFQKIKPAYQDYKKNKIDFNKFCQIINPKAPKPLSVSKIPSQGKGSKQIISENMLQTNSVMKQESNIKNQTQNSIKNISNNQKSSTDKRLNSHSDLQSIAQHSKQASNQVSRQPSKLNSEARIQQKKVSKIQQKAQVNAPFILPQVNIQKSNKLVSQNLVYKSDPHGKSLQVRQNLIQKDKILSGRQIKKQETPVKFQASEMNESRYTVTPQKIQPNITINGNMMKKNPQKTIYGHQQQQKYGNNIDFRPVTYNKVPQIPQVTKQEILQNITQTPIKKNTHNELDSILAIHNQLRQHEAQQPKNTDDQMISGPSLNPLTFSYHDFLSKENKNKKMKTFKQAINNDYYFIKANKNSNMFKFQSEANSLIRPVTNSLKKGGQSATKINVNELLQQRSKKYELQMRLLQKGKDMKIKQLQNRLNAVQREKNILSHQIKAKQNQINTIRAYSQLDPAKSRTDQYSLVDDQNYVMKKLVAANNTHHKKLAESVKNQSALLATGQLINSKKFQSHFRNISDQKLKKIQMKNKQLLYKDQYIQIGYMGHLQDNIYNIACFITPEGDFSLLQVMINGSQKLNIEHDIEQNLHISSKKQAKRHFKVQVIDIPYNIPQVVFLYKINNYQQSVKFILPCAFHKFFTIQAVQPSRFEYQFIENNIIRGQQIPYSRKILKNIDLLHDFLPHIQKLNKGEGNNLGEICFGGQASYKRTNLLIKISIKPNQFLYIQVEQPKKDEDLKVIQFYISTLNHFLMKDFSWA